MVFAVLIRRPTHTDTGTGRKTLATDLRAVRRCRHTIRPRSSDHLGNYYRRVMDLYSAIVESPVFGGDFCRLLAEQSIFSNV